MSSALLTRNFEVNSENVTYGADEIVAKYPWQHTELEQQGEKVVVRPVTTTIEFRTERKVPKLGLMLVGLGGNNGTTVTAGILANRRKLAWRTREGKHEANWYGSVTQSSTVRVGELNGKEMYVPFNEMLPMVNPNDIEIGGWDISSMNLGDAMERACVLDVQVQDALKEEMSKMKPLPAVYDPAFIAANQSERADNVMKGTKAEQLAQVRRDLQQFKAERGVDKVIVLWTANTERYSKVEPGVHDTAANLLAAVEANHAEVSPSTIYALACLQEGVPFINGAPQNTFVPGVIELAMQRNVPIGGDDFKSGQTKMKSVLVDFLVNAGIKPTSIVSYNHLGNNDGRNLSAPQTFRSKEISKSDVVNDMVDSVRGVLYKEGEHPDHIVVIKYQPAVGDSKRAMDEYTSEIFMGGKNTIAMYNTCEDSLLAAPLIIDLVLLMELSTRIRLSEDGAPVRNFHPVSVILSYLTKAPLPVPGTHPVNALSRQRLMMENLLRACVGLPPETNLQCLLR